MVKFSRVELPSPSSSSLLHDIGGLMLKTPTSTPIVLQQCEKYVDPERARWTALEEAILVHLMVKEVRKGNKVNPMACKRVWKSIEHGFYEKTRKRLSLSQLKNKFNSLRARYSEFRKLLKKPGFDWNPALGRATATNDDWEAYIKEHEIARIFRRKGFPLYNELGAIFGDAVHGCNKVTQSIQCSPDREFKCGKEDESTKPSHSAFVKDSIYMEQDAVISAGHLPQQSLPPGGQNQRGTDLRASVACGPMKELEESALTYAAFKEHFLEIPRRKETNSSPDAPKSCSSAFSITSCIKCLESIPEIGSSTYIKAVKMFKDVEWREVFMAMSAERRLDWLASLD